jgi:hypothetical protein
MSFWDVIDAQNSAHFSALGKNAQKGPHFSSRIVAKFYKSLF